jgi:hypothetical protein
LEIIGDLSVSSLAILPEAPPTKYRRIKVNLNTASPQESTTALISDISTEESNENKAPSITEQLSNQQLVDKYARAATLQQKVNIVFRAIHDFYPLINADLEKYALGRFISYQPKHITMQWIQRLESLYTRNNEDLNAKNFLINTALSCWGEIQQKEIEAKVNDKREAIEKKFDMLTSGRVK